VNELPPDLVASPGAATPNPPPAAGAEPVRAAPPLVSRLGWGAGALLGALTVASLVLAWKADQRVLTLEQELVRRQQDSAALSTEARMLAKQANEGMGSTAAKLALLEARVAEVAVQRGQLEDLIQSLSRSRDENILVDVEAAIRVALQQTAITGSAEPLVATLKQSDERLARYNQPRLEGVRRAIVRDLDRVKAASVADISVLGIKLDEAIRMVDELPLVAVVAMVDTRREPAKDAAKPAPATSRGASAAGGRAASAAPAWSAQIGEFWNTFSERIWGEAKSLVRVTQTEHPDAMLLAPEQSYFLRENLKLRLLNARLALLSRQFNIAQTDLQGAQAALDRYFDRGSKRTLLATDLVKQVATQARQVGVPRPDDTLAALTAAGGR
jgi:uroporphyrin-III C-methyltransferase